LIGRADLGGFLTAPASFFRNESHPVLRGRASSVGRDDVRCSGANGGSRHPHSLTAQVNVPQTR
jgi:hypothetical protein